MNASAAPPLVFSWSPPRRRARALIFFLIASFLVHAMCFYLFQIVYPPTIALPPAPARLSVITPDDPSALNLLRWVEAEDPALATATMRALDARPITFPALSHVPSFASHQPTLKPLPETPANLTVPSVFSLTASRTSPPLATTVAPSSPTQRTAVLFSDAERDLGHPPLPDFTWKASVGEAPANARFRIAVDEYGALRYCFVSESSGDPELDEQSRRFLQLVPFPRNENSSGLTWVVVSVLWGNDIGSHLPATPAPAAPTTP